MITLVTDDDSAETRLGQLLQREHLLAAIADGLDRWPEVLQLIADAPDTDQARAGLRSALALDQPQAQAVLDIQFRRVTHRDRLRITEELAEMRAQIARMRQGV